MRNINALKKLFNTTALKDAYLVKHQGNVCIYSNFLALKMGLNGNLRNAICQAAILHDVGKVRIPSSIVFKQGELTEREWEIMKCHSTLGAEMLNNIDVKEEVVEAVRCHHERWDGQGYPLGLKREEIPLIARIISVADAYDAMTTDRPYRMALSHQEVIAELVRCKGEQFDPWLVDVFVKDVVGSSVSKHLERFIST